jgi:hemerythrin-like domain-containing protein
MHTHPAVLAAPIRDRFMADHVRLELILEKLYAAFAADDREAMASQWAAFETGLLAHLEAEEADLLPALLRVSQRDVRILVQEHRHIRNRLAELGTMVELHTIRLESVRNFIDELRAHGQSEDRLLYKWAETHLDDADKKSIIDSLRLLGKRDRSPR